VNTRLTPDVSMPMLSATAMTELSAMAVSW
jgi:hypothetical protein